MPQYPKFSIEDIREFRYMLHGPMPEHNIQTLIDLANAKEKMAQTEQQEQKTESDEDLSAISAETEEERKNKTEQEILQEVKDYRKNCPDDFKFIPICNMTDEAIAETITNLIQTTGMETPQAIWELLIQQ